MKWLILSALVLSDPGFTDKCAGKEWRCELRCGDKTPGGSMERLKCYDKCREKEQECRNEK